MARCAFRAIPFTGAVSTQETITTATYSIVAWLKAPQTVATQKHGLRIRGLVLSTVYDKMSCSCFFRWFYPF